MNKELNAKVECFTIKKPKYQKLYIQDSDYVDTIVINEKEYKCSDIVKHEKALEIIKEKKVNVYNFSFYINHHKNFTYKDYKQILNEHNEDLCDLYEIIQFCEQGKELTEEEYDLLKEVLLCSR